MDATPQVSEEQLVAAFSAIANDGTDAQAGSPTAAADKDASVTAPPGMTALEAVRVVRDPVTNMGRGIAFVLFTTKSAARAALALDGRELVGRPMRVTRVSKTAAEGSSTGSRAVATGSRSGGRGRGHAGGGSGRAGSGRGQTVDPADWQGLRTKGRGAGLRGPGTGARPGGNSIKNKGRPGGSSRGVVKAVAGMKQARGGKRPAVAARKAASKTAAARAKKSGGSG
jgi:nucleolar protein 12